MRALLAVLLLVTLAFAGCSDGPKGDGGDGTPTPTASSSQSSTSRSSSTTAAPAPVPNRPRTAQVAANVTSGKAPQAVSFTLSGSDPDADALTYTLSFGDGSADVTGTLPATQNHTYSAVGNHTVRVVVSDGKAEDDATVSIGVVAGSSAVALPPAVTFTGTATGVCQLFDPTTFEDICLPEDSVIQHAFTMPAAAKQIVVSLTWDMPAPGASDLDLYVTDSAGEEVGSSACANVDPAPNPDIPEFGSLFGCVRGTSEEATITEIALSKEDTWTATIVPYQAPMLEYTLTVTYS